MTPDDFAAILAARTPGPWRESPSQDAVVGQARLTGGEEYAAYTFHDNAAAIVAAVNLAPLLLDLWRAAATDGHRMTWSGDDQVCDLDQEDWPCATGAALAALEAATP